MFKYLRKKGKAKYGIGLNAFRNLFINTENNVSYIVSTNYNLLLNIYLHISQHENSKFTLGNNGREWSLLYVGNCRCLLLEPYILVTFSMASIIVFHRLCEKYSLMPKVVSTWFLGSVLFYGCIWFNGDLVHRSMSLFAASGASCPAGMSCVLMREISDFFSFPCSLVFSIEPQDIHTVVCSWSNVCVLYAFLELFKFLKS